jgi:hypothetical protein
MSKKTFDQEDRKPFDLFKEGDATKKHEKLSEDDLVNALRSDMLLTSSESPAQKNVFERINLKYVFGISLTLFIIIFAWFMFGGPGRPILEHSLVSLVHDDATSTQPIVLAMATSTATPIKASETPIPSPTTSPSRTPTARIVASATKLPSTSTPTSTPACRDALTISLVDVGQTLCVQGMVIETIDRPNGFMVIFNTAPGSFYWVSYDMVWPQAELDTCYQTTGLIEQLGSNPILLFDYSNIPELCP